MAQRRRDLEVFHKANAAKIPWDERLELIRKMFPSTEKLDWNKVFRDDPAICGQIINDIMKASTAAPSRPGKRAAVEPEVAREQLLKLAGDDYSCEDFPTALKALMGKRSIRQTAAKTGLNRNAILRLVHGDLLPDAYMMETIARAFDKDPSFFLEYRVGWILTALSVHMVRVPESSVHHYRKMRGIGKHR